MQQAWDEDLFLYACEVFNIEVEGKVLVGWRCRFRVGEYSDRLFERYGIPFPPHLGRAVGKRRSDYLAGRVCARQALGMLGVTGEELDVQTGISREPIWPAGIAGSISHTAEQAVCIVTNERNVLGVGIDIEREISEELANDVKSQVVDAAEEFLIHDAFASFNQGLTIVFSGKESIYKAVHPTAKCFFGFTAVKMAEIQASTILFCIAEKIADCLPVGTRIAVRYEVRDGTIQSAACVTS